MKQQERLCPYRQQCVSRPEEQPDCIPDYQRCLVYKFEKQKEAKLEKLAEDYP